MRKNAGNETYGLPRSALDSLDDGGGFPFGVCDLSVEVAVVVRVCRFGRSVTLSLLDDSDDRLYFRDERQRRCGVLFTPIPIAAVLARFLRKTFRVRWPRLRIGLHDRDVDELVVPRIELVVLIGAHQSRRAI